MAVSKPNCITNYFISSRSKVSNDWRIDIVYMLQNQDERFTFTSTAQVTMREDITEEEKRRIKDNINAMTGKDYSYWSAAPYYKTMTHMINRYFVVNELGIPIELTESELQDYKKPRMITAYLYEYYEW